MNEAYVEHIVKSAFRRAYAELSADRSDLGPDTIHVGELTYCLLKSYYERKYGVNYSDEKIVILGLGQATHFLVESFVGEGVVKEFRVEHGLEGFKLTGRPDLIVDDAVIELKTTSHIPVQPFSHHVLQLQAYLHLLDRRYGFIVYVCKRRGRVKAFRVERDPGAWEEIVGRARRLHLALVRGEPPEPEPGPLCRYCEFRSMCRKLARQEVVPV